MTKTPAFASEFPAASETDWRALVDGVLKGAPFEKKLISKTADGLAIQPLYARKAGAQPIAGVRGVAPWGIVARLDHPDASTANALALEELEGGADTLSLAFAGSPAARGFGLKDASKSTFDAAFAGIHADLVTLRIEPGPKGAAHALAFGEWLKARRYVPSALKISFGLDPIGAALRGDYADFASAMSDAITTIKALQNLGFAGPFLACDSRLVHEAGASEAVELGAVAASIATYLRALSETGFTLPAARAALGFTLVADQDQVLTLAKFRAFRLILARIEEACGHTPSPAHVHAETAWRMMTRRDPHTNILRTTIATFAAGLGGADSIAVLPFTSALGLPDGFARRLARNTSLILTAETNLHRVIDPAAGSGGIEGMTDALAAQGWAEFQAIEAQSTNAARGLVAALANGTLAGKIAATNAARAKDLATRRMSITGTSEFPNVSEKPVEVLLPAPQHTADGPFASRRFSEGYEALRDRAEALTAKGQAPKVFLANLGRIADFTARTTFAKNIFEAGGIVAIGNDGFAEADGGTDLVAMTDAFKASGAQLACLCSSDAVYAQEAQDAAMALVASGASGVYLAGRPTELEASLRAAGVNDFVYVGCDVLATLAAALKAQENA